ncbi:MAG: amidohydrolase family protein [Coriobacteriales bacterium]|nr:amidohydrolase family protein [Coriobacteriales bacterium]
MPSECPSVDIHVHVYPQKVAERAVQSVGDFYGVKMTRRGLVDDYLNLREPSGIKTSAILSVANKPELVTSINDFIAEISANDPSMIGFAAMHQDFNDMEAEVERCIALGLKGFKIHPDSQAVNIDDPRLMHFYGLIEGRLPLTVHAGDYRYDYSHPRRIREVLHAFPNLRLNTAHFGGWSIFDLSVEYLENERNYMDTSSSMIWLGLRRTKELIEHYGADRVMFGTDFPMFDPAEELRLLRACGLSQRDLEQVCCRSAESFLGMDLV